MAKGNPKGNPPTNFANNKKVLEKAIAGQKTEKSRMKKAVASSINQSNVLVQGIHRRITPDTQQMIRDELTKQDKGGTPYIHQFIKAFLKEAKDDPSSNAGRMLASTMFNDKLLETLDSEVNKQMNRDIGFAEYRIRQTLYDKQQEVFDNKQDKTILVINSRRSGKTELMGRLLAKRVLRPDQHCVYINRSFDAAVRQIQKPLETALQAAGLSYSGTVNGGKLDFDNGSWILIIGNNNVADVNKLRGERLALAILDECGHERNVRQLMQEVIQPASMDYEDSQIVFVGTPPRTKINYIQDLWDNPKIKKYHWTFEQNPFIPNKENVIKEVCELNGVTPDSPFIQREYYGVMGAVDTDAEVFRGYQKVDRVPTEHLFTHSYVAIDWGYEDKAAVVSIVANSHSKEAYIVRDWSMSKQSISTICQEAVAQVAYLKEHFKLEREPVVVCDTNEKGASFELYQTYKVPNVMNAYKYDKDMAIEQFSEWLRVGTIKTCVDAKSCIEDFDNTIWKRDEETDQILHDIDDECWHPNAAWAAIYASRMFAFDILGIMTSEAENRTHRLVNGE